MSLINFRISQANGKVMYGSANTLNQEKGRVDIKIRFP